MTLGVEGKKAKWALGVLFAVLGWAVYSSFFSGPSSPDPSPAAHVDAASTGEDAAEAAQTARTQLEAHAHDEFLPAVHRRGSKPLDPNTVDPTIHTELLAKLDEVPSAGSGRDLFSFGKPPVALKDPEPVVKPKPEPIGPPVIKPPEKAAPAVVPVPVAAPITLKYYGIVTTLANGKKRAFFMDGDEILIETEGVTFKGHYRLVRIGVSSAIVEDTQGKHEQTLPLAEDAQG